MFEPDNRSLLLSALRPPLGYRFDRGIATTYTMDFLSALSAPLALAGYWVADNLETQQVDHISICDALEAVRSRLDIFVQAGNTETTIGVKSPTPLIALLEPMIHEVRRPAPGRLFHPKIWLLRFTHNSEVPLYRCLILSRNLTQDRSWDMVLTLDSTPDRRNRNSQNEQLVRLVESLPARTTVPMSAERIRAIEEFAKELSSVHWELPEGFTHIDFYAYGVPGLRSTRPESLFAGKDHLIVSPFASSTALQRVLKDASGRVQLVTRVETAQQLSPNLRSRMSIFVLDVSSTADNSSELSSAAEAARTFDDIHAKAYLVELKSDAYVYVGSANATDAAFSGNTEILVELQGSRKVFGIDQVFGEDSAFRNALTLWSSDEEPVALPADEQHLRMMQSYLVDLAEVGFEIDATERDEKWQCRIRSRRAVPPLPKQLSFCEVRVGPVFSLHEGYLLSPGKPVDVDFVASDLADVSAFLRLTISAAGDSADESVSAIVRGELRGVPATRQQDVIVRLIDTPEKLLRFLQLLLALGQKEAVNLSDMLVGGVSGNSAWVIGDRGVLESLVEALARDPEALVRLAPVIQRIIETGDRHKVLPDGWHDLWSAITLARTQLEAS
jgi:hypothetical protein